MDKTSSRSIEQANSLSVLKTVNALNLSVDIVDLKKVLTFLTQEKDLSQVEPLM